jgi:hypothetical protein
VSHLLLLQLLVESVGLSGASSALPRVKVSFNGWSGWLGISTPAWILCWLGMHVVNAWFQSCDLKG